MKAKFFVGDALELNESVNSFLEEAGNIRQEGTNGSNKQNIWYR